MTLDMCGHVLWPLEAKRCTLLAQCSILGNNATLEGDDVTL